MTMYQQDRGRVETARVRLSGTGATEIVDGGENGTLIEDILVANTGSGTPDITIDCYDETNTTAYVLLQEHSLTAKSTENTTTDAPRANYRLTMPMWLPKNWLLRVTSTVGSSVVHVTVTHVRPVGRQQ